MPCSLPSGKTVITVTGKQIGLTGEVAEGMELYETSGQNAAVSLTYGAALPDGVTWTKVTKNPFTLTSKPGDGTYQDFLNNEARYTRLVKPFPERAEKLFKESEEVAKARYEHLERLVELYK